MLTHGLFLSSPAFASPLLVLTVLSDDEGSTVQACGELDLSTAGQLAGTVRRLIQQGRRRVQLDLAQLQFIDAAGLEALLEAHNAMLSAAGELLIINVQPRTHRLLELTGLEQVLDVAEPQ